MRLFAFSDWRVQDTDLLFDILDRLDEPVDLIVYAGDDINRFKDDELNIFSELASETRLGKVLAVRGNDELTLADLAFDEDVDTSEDVLEGDGVHNLHEEPFTIENYAFLGLEGAIEGGPGFILYSEEEIENHLWNQYSGIEDSIPVVVSHPPPHGILDIGQRFGQRHIGSISLRSFIEEVEPTLTVCGHCHQFGGRAVEEEFGVIINIASDDKVGAEGRYAIVELDGNDLEYELTTTEEGADHLLYQFSQVGVRRVQHFLDSGISELEELNEANRETLLELPGVYEWHVNMWMEEAHAIRDGEFRVLDNQEFDFLNRDNSILVDIETDLSQDRIWLVGLYSYRDDEFTQIFERDDEEELLDCFIEYLHEYDGPSIVYYGNNRFDEKCLKRRMEAHDKTEGIALMENSFDLGIKIHNYLLGDFRGTNLESLAGNLADYDYKYPELDGFIVGSQYTRYLLDNEEPDWNKLLEYNKDDVLSMKAVVDEIREIMS